MQNMSVTEQDSQANLKSNAAEEKVCTLVYGQDFLDELSKLSATKQTFDVISSTLKIQAFCFKPKP